MKHAWYHKGPMRFRQALLVLGMTITAPGIAANPPMPRFRDIPPDFTTTICATPQAAEQMLRSLSVRPAPNNHDVDVQSYFRALSATGCVQDYRDRKDEVTIKRVLARTSFRLATRSTTWMAYEGRLSGKKIFGIVDEQANDQAPRTPLDRWMSGRTTTPGQLDVTAPTEVPLAYACPTGKDARGVVTGLGTGSASQRKQQFSSLLRIKGCAKASGIWRPTALLGNVSIECGFECANDWTALEAIDPKGRKMGLIYDGSMM